MPELLQDLLWQFADALDAIFDALINLVLSSVGTRRRYRTKSLAYEIRTSMPDGISAAGPKPIKGSVTMMVKVTNIGSAPITAPDISSGLCIDLEDGRRVYSAEVVEYRGSVAPSIGIEPGRIILRPQRLGRRETLAIRAVIDGSEYGVCVQVRITNLQTDEPKSSGPKDRAENRPVIGMTASPLSSTQLS